jgi:phosphatidyl-myo-inositol dimannoside synthase
VRLLADPELCARWGAAGRRWVRENWTWAASADRLATLLD